MNFKSISLGLFTSAFLVSPFTQAYPGFSNVPKSGSKLGIVESNDLGSSLSLLEEAKTFTLSVQGREPGKEKKMRVIFMVNDPVAEADPEIPSHIISVRGSEMSDDLPQFFNVDRMFVTKVTKISSNRLHVEGYGGFAYECSEARSFDLELTSKLEKDNYTLSYELKYLNVVDKKTGDKCSIYD